VAHRFGSYAVYGGEVFSKGDAALFVSHKYHNVRPITAGKRTVLVVELWEGQSSFFRFCWF
jgi:hypothetical protein